MARKRLNNDIWIDSITVKWTDGDKIWMVNITLEHTD